ncbi:coiled-coil domain-containing protein 27 isoform X2 [Phasianus colchicus]|uniref:coiled-coil domain-containing protein 27 isoform X2 n=1 Tax=Phasianus colchicus TaxID=9054 RepID=UPI00129E7AEF|nr:coiled-coil domain-containing protein 27 isoform X2 [Phasianus colchicus]
MGSRGQPEPCRQPRAPCEAQGPRSSSCLPPGSEPSGPLGLAPEPRHDELRIPAPLRASCPGTCDRATSPGPPDLRSGHGPAGERDGKKEPPGQQQPAGEPYERHSDNVPWYIRTINEKEECLSTLVAEIDRLAKYQAECAQKDVVIANLLREVERLKKQLKLLKDSADTEEHTETKQRSSSEDATDVLNEASALGAILEQAEAEKQALMAQLTAFQKAHKELCAELQKAEDDYNMATGAMCSLQRQLEIQESQLRRTKSENERLQKEIRGRENQLQAMSAKFGSLREERKHEEMMAAMEKENYSLQQVVTEQESKLREQMELISGLQGTTWQLQAEALTNRYHIQKQQHAQEKLQSQTEMLQHTELQTRVALERVTSKDAGLTPHLQKEPRSARSPWMARPRSAPSTASCCSACVRSEALTQEPAAPPWKEAYIYIKHTNVMNIYI